jgi:hypothetical protein
VAGSALVVVGRKQQVGTLRRNWLVGLRTSETMRSDAAWYAAHSATGGLVMASGVVQVIAGAMVLILQPQGEGTIAAIVLGSAAASSVSCCQRATADIGSRQDSMKQVTTTLPAERSLLVELLEWQRRQPAGPSGALRCWAPPASDRTAFAVTGRQPLRCSGGR